jgi:hypothetical protein
MMKDGTRNLRLTQNHPPHKTAGRVPSRAPSQENSASEGSHLINRDQTARLERLAAAARLANQIPLPAITYLLCLPGGGKNRQKPVPTPDKSGTPIS